MITVLIRNLKSFEDRPSFERWAKDQKSGVQIAYVEGDVKTVTPRTQTVLDLDGTAESTPPESTKAARAYKPRKANLDAVVAALSAANGYALDIIAKAAGTDKATTGRVLAYLAAQSIAVETGGLWRLMPGAMGVQS